MGWGPREGYSAEDIFYITMKKILEIHLKPSNVTGMCQMC
jgi:hypothetical protein